MLEIPLTSPCRQLPPHTAPITILAITASSFLCNMPRFFELQTASYNVTVCNATSERLVIEPTALRLHPAYSGVSMLCSTLVLNLLPLAALALLNYR